METQIPNFLNGELFLLEARHFSDERFTISGYFAFKHYISGKEVAEPEHFPVIYAVKKLLKILPYSSIAIILMFLKQTIEHNLSFREGAGAAGLFIVEVLSFAGVALIATLTVSSYEVLFIILLIISLSITFSGVTVSSKMHGSVFTFLGKLSLPIYCIHPVVRAFVGDENIGMFFLLTIAAAIVMVVVVEGIGKIFKHNG